MWTCEKCGKPNEDLAMICSECRKLKGISTIKQTTNSFSCPVCNNLCSTQAISCPKCGHPISQNVSVKISQTPPSQTTGSVLRSVLWLFFAISAIYAFGAIKIYNNMPLPVVPYNDAEILADNIAIGYHLAPLIVMIIVLAITYSAKERK